MQERTVNLVPVTTPYMLTERAEIKDRIGETVADLLAEGNTLKQAANKVGVSRSLLFKLRRQFPDFTQQLDQASFDGAVAILEELKETPYLEECPQRARVKIDALQRYLELRWPQRFGKRLDVKISTVDIGNALQKARARAGVLIESVACAVIAEDAETSCTEEDLYQDEIDPFDETPGG